MYSVGYISGARIKQELREKRHPPQSIDRTFTPSHDASGQRDVFHALRASEIYTTEYLFQL